MNVTTDAREHLRSLAYRLTGATGRRITLSDALLAACAVANQNIDDAAAVLTTEEGRDQ